MKHFRILLLIALVLVAITVWYFTTQRSGNVQGITTTRWDFNGQTWQASGTRPNCPSPLILTTPVDLSRATAILYPGQTRGGNYKAHGGFRFDKGGSVTVKAPMDATVTRGSRYIEGGEIQYLFEFVNSCGIMYRFDHLRVLSPKLAQIAGTFPAAKKDDTRTTFINTSPTVTAGEVLATGVGFQKTNNISVDWGVYDLRNKNVSSKNTTWAVSKNSEQAHYGVCWFDLLSSGDKAKVKKLPAGDSTSGKKSDYCK